MTMRAAILGHPAGQALSPLLHRAAYQELRLDWTYDAIDCTPGGCPGSSPAWTAAGPPCH